MLYRMVAKPAARNVTSEAEGVSYARVPERIIDVDSKRIDFFATISDPRNWRNAGGHKESSVLLWLLRQWNGLPKSSAKTLYVIGEISMNQIRKGTGMDPRTIEGAMTGLGRKGIIDVDVVNSGTREARYLVGLCLPVSDWKLPHIHEWREPRVAYYPF